MGSSLLLALALATALGDTLPTVHPNDNRLAAGTERAGVLRVDLEMRWGGWRPDAAVDSAVTIRAFAERGKGLQTPGPLIRARRGSRVHLTIRNTFGDSALIIHGLRAGTSRDDTLQLAPGAVREIEFTADSAGTFLYWATTTAGAITDRIGRTTQLNGVIVIDNRPIDPRERIFVVSMIDILPDTTRPGPIQDVFEVAINGLSWPGTERLAYEVGDSVHWRWINASDRVHPMHLHGFHFRVTTKGSGTADTTYGAGSERLAVTELMLPGSTFQMAWTPTRAGNWLMHCHMIPHITPFPVRPDTAPDHDLHDVARHPLVAMSGLVLGITVSDPKQRGASRPGRAARELRLLAQEKQYVGTASPRTGFVLQDGSEPSPDSVSIPGTPLILRRDETVRITVVNHLTRPTTVHWHGMELESVYDGVSGWSMSDRLRAPMVAPGDSFAVTFTPPRAGTYMYHTHMDEGNQLRAGMYGPMIVLEPGESWDTERNLIQMVGSVVDGTTFRPALGGNIAPVLRELTAGITYRFRIINMHPVAPMLVSLAIGDSVLTWTPVAKDGAALPQLRLAPTRAKLLIGVGETYDFSWLARSSAQPAEFRITYGVRGGFAPIVQQIRVQ